MASRQAPQTPREQRRIELKATSVSGLRELAGGLGVGTEGLRKADLIEQILLAELGPVTRRERRHAELKKMPLFTGRDGDLHGLALRRDIDPIGLRKCDVIEYILRAELGR